MNDELRSIKKASFVKRLLAFLMDGSVTLFIFFAFFLFVFSPIATHAFGYKDLYKQGSDLQLNSHLFVLLKEDDTRNTPLTEINEENIEFYTEKLKYYYCTYKTIEAPDCNDLIDDGNGNQVLPKDYYTEAWFNAKMVDVTTIEKAKEASYDALVDFSKYVSPISNKIKLCEIFIIIPSFSLSFGIFYFVIPLCFKNGETLGKKTMGLALVTKDGYDVKKRQIILRELFLYVYTAFFSFFLTIGYGSFAMLGLGALIYFIAAFISKTNRSFADYLAYTYLIDGKNSVWFKDLEEEKNKNLEVQKNLEKYNKVKDENPNLLQVGSTIVNEEAKREIEESSKGNVESKK